MAGNTMSAPEARSSTHRSQRKTALSLVVKAGPLLVAAGLALMSETVAGEATLAVGGNHACIISTTGGVKVRQSFSAGSRYIKELDFMHWFPVLVVTVGFIFPVANVS